MPFPWLANRQDAGVLELLDSADARGSDVLYGKDSRSQRRASPSGALSARARGGFTASLPAARSPGGRSHLLRHPLIRGLWRPGRATRRAAVS
jgi:hypothetical protein